MSRRICRPETALQISGVNRQRRDSAIQRLEQPPDPMAECPSQPQRPQSQVQVASGTVPARRRLEREEAQDVLQPHGHSRSPRRTCPRCQAGARKPRAGSPKTSVKTRCPRSSVRRVSSRSRPFISSQPLGEQRGRSPASLTLMEVAVKEKLLGALPDQPAVVGMRRQRPLAVPVGDHPEGETTPDEGREVPDHHPSLTGVGRGGVVDTDEEAPGHGAVRWIPPYRRSRAANASNGDSRDRPR